MGFSSQLFSRKNVLVTGGAGFIGSNLALRLAELGANVTLVDSLIPEYGGNLFNIKEIENTVKLNIADVRDEYSMTYLVQGQHYLFNLAGQTSHLDSMQNPYADLDINCRAQLAILEACRKHASSIRVIYASTRQLYGKPTYLPVDERHPTLPTDVNGINKLSGELYHLLYSNVYGIRATVLRLTNTYGPRMRVRDARQTFLGVWIRMLLDGAPIEVWGGDQLRDFTFVDDCVDALLVAASNQEAEGKVYNLGGEPPIALKDLAATMIRIYGSGTYQIRQFPPDRLKIDIGDYYSDFSMIKRELGWSPRVSLSEGLMRTLDFYKRNRASYW